MPAPSVVLFDLGGVVMDWDPAPRLALLSADCGLPEAEVHRRVFEDGLARDFDAGRYTSEQWYEAVRDTLGLRMDFEALRDVYLGVFRPPDHELLWVVDALRAVTRTAMLTDNPPMLLEALPTRYPELLSRFDPILFSCELGCLKPSREAFEAALARLDVPPAAVLFVDDTVANVAAARDVGMDAVPFEGLVALRRELERRGLLPDGAGSQGRAAPAS
ncbi:MAG: HAD-IA family hydrolase [Dehalococcoidia bacterium]|nr:HAD-IA family hydrolase [Dehalococcoidia bacterium]